MSKKKVNIQTYYTIKENDLIFKIKEINKIFYEASLSLDCYYANSWNNFRIATVVTPKYMKFLAYQSFKNYIIEISKLVKKSHNEYFNLFNLLEELKSSNTHLYFDYNILKDAYDMLCSYKDNNESMLYQIIEIRDKVFAHTDSDYEKYDQFISHQQTTPLMNCISDLLKSINNSIKLNDKLRFNYKGNYPGHLEFFDDLYKKYNNEQGEY